MDLYNISTIKSLLSRHGFTFSKALGQNFLINPDVCPNMAKESGCTENTLAIEIGPGIGVLTKELCRTAGKVIAIELDRRLIPVLKETLGEFDNLEVINDDVMKLDLKAVIEEKKGVFTDVVICANLPYYITSPVIMMLLEERLPVRCVTVMVQREAAQRICANVGQRDSSALTAAVAYYSVPQLLFHVPRECFMPSPNVDSAVIRLDLRKEPCVDIPDEKRFFSLIKGCFAQRRKTAVNSINATLGISKETLISALEAIGERADVRGEKLTMEQLARLDREIWS